ncbi:hypothetical protein [Haematomicrobium sanguinis]|uniref:hypothetical protein n=1 Tax=Haematomicrobium sanguinis TaxID=479106 RepID=UPI00047DD38C|nr:hypothetical protein [Haematomicrobium sanguinis]
MSLGRSHRRGASALLAGLVTLAGFGLAGCQGGNPNSVPSNASVTGISAEWLKTTAEEWPKSDGFTSSIAYFKKGPCLIADTLPKILDVPAKLSDQGYGDFGDAGKVENAYTYQCSFWSNERYAGALTLQQAPDSEQAQAAVEEFNQPKSYGGDRENTVSTVSSRGVDIDVVRTWIPPNPQGAYTALYFDESKNALVTLNVNSLSEVDFATLTEQQVADYLTAIIVASTQ